MNIIKAFSIGLLSIAIASPAFATPTRIINTTCIWSGDDGTMMKQKCKIYGNSSWSGGTSFHLKWEDGVKTVVHAETNSTQYITPESKKDVELHGEFVFGRMGLPRQIHIEGLGITFITYQDYYESKDYESFDL
jgi:hypothetical protein